MTPDRSEANRASDELVEKVAEAIWMADAEPIGPEDRIPWNVINGFMKEQCYAEARAALRVALEEAAKVAERTSGTVRQGNIAEVLYIPPSAKDAAAAIRALIPKD